jgi:hypothetical protein
MKWRKPPRLLWYSGVIGYFVIQFLILFYEAVTLPEKGIVFFFEMREYSESSGAEVDIGIVTQSGIIFLASGFPFIIQVYRVFALAIFIYVYLTTDYAIIDKRIKTARNLWIIAGATGAIYPILILGHGFSLWTMEPLFPDLFTLMALFLIGYVTIRYPEAVLLSQVQLARATNLYQMIAALESEEQILQFGITHLVEYIRRIPPELINQA